MKPETRAALLSSYDPALIPLKRGLTAAAFPVMKIFPAEMALRQAANDGMLGPKTEVLETSSGSMAVGLAVVCRWYGLRLRIVTDPGCDIGLKRRLEDLGARVEIVEASPKDGSYQTARLERIAEVRESVPDHFWVNQYDNPGNAASYGRFASRLLDLVGKVDFLVAPVGSGGSSCGTAYYLRQVFPETRLVGVDTFGSVLFGQPDSPRALRGLGNSILPTNLDHTAFDEVHWVNAAEAFTATRVLHHSTTIFAGPTSGASWLVANRYSELYPRRRVVCVLPDNGFRYIDSVYDDDYMRRNAFWMSPLPKSPREVMHPSEARDSWSWFRWGRRSLADVTGAPAPSELVEK